MVLTTGSADVLERDEHGNNIIPPTYHALYNFTLQYSGAYSYTIEVVEGSNVDIMLMTSVN